jgi:hypothetical protein
VSNLELVSSVNPDAVMGSTTPRLAPAPLVSGAPGDCPCGACALTPETSYGFEIIDFARDVLGTPLDPWQEYLVVHAGELLPDGRPRFKKVLVIVSRQQGKTFLLMVMTLFWMFVEQWPLIIGQHVNVSKARGVWQAAQQVAKKVPELKADFGTVRMDNNDPHWLTAFGSKYAVEAANENGGRGGSVDRLVVDEARQQRSWKAYDAAKPTLNARPYGQGWWITNQGDSRSVVVIGLRKTAIANIEAVKAGGEAIDPQLAIFEWSAPKGSNPLDPEVIAMACPNVNRRVSMREILGDAMAAMESGDQDKINGYLTEILCMFVPSLDGAVSPDGWARGREPGELAGVRGRLAMVPELAPDRQHSSISVAAMMPDGRVRVEVIASWSGMFAAAELRRALPGWVRKVRPKKLGWIPGGGAATLAAELADASKFRLPGLEIEEIRGEVQAVCMGFAELVDAGEILHSGNEEATDLLSKQVLGSAKLWTGDVWRFSRKGEGHCDTAYGVAAATHLARTMPPPRSAGRLRVITGSADKQQAESGGED